MPQTLKANPKTKFNLLNQELKTKPKISSINTTKFLLK